jgi:hypothetical protein
VKIILRLAASLFLSDAVIAQNPTPASHLPTWPDEMAKGFVPYHQLAIEDFPINDKAHPEATFWIKPFIIPRYYCYLKPGVGMVYAYVAEWVVFSGLDKNESTRKSRFHDMKNQLPFAQALLDINEVSARELAALKSGDLPRGSGPSFEAAKRDLEGQMNVFLNQKYEKMNAGREAFLKATDHGQNKKKVQELGAGLAKRLEAMAPLAPSPIPSATPAPIASPSPN